MAKVIVHSMNHDSSASAEEKLFSVTISGTKNKNNFKFTIQPPRIIVEQQPKSSDPVDWNKDLTKEEKLQVFRIIGDYYSQFSYAGMKIAAIGTVRNPDPAAPPDQQHLLFIGVNTERRANEYFKDCAEQNMVNAATIIVSQLSGKKASNQDHAPILLESSAISGSQKGNPAENKPDIIATCPCGKCQDMLALSMVPEGEIDVIPRIPHMAKLNLRTNASYFDQVNLHKEIWCTTIKNLNNNRVVDLKNEDAALQKNAFSKIVHDASLQNTKLDEPMDGATQEWIKKAAEKAKENTLTGRISTAELDVAADGSGNLAPEVVNQFMQRKIRNVLANRLMGKGIVGDEKAALDFVKNKQFEYIRCVVIRTDDNSFHYGIDSNIQGDKSHPNADVNALTRSLEGIGTHGIREVWAMRFKPSDIVDGKMTTSSKEGLERIIKRCSQQIPLEKIPFHYMPFNDGTLAPNEAAALMKRYTYGANEIYPGMHTGATNIVARVSGKSVENGPRAF